MKEEKHIYESKFGWYVCVWGGVVLQLYLKKNKKQPKIILTNKQNINNILKKFFIRGSKIII